MNRPDSFSKDTFWQEDPFRFIKPEEFESLGIDPADIPLGTFAALKHPSQLPSRFGGNAYGFGLYEFNDRLKPRSAKLLQSINFEKPDDTAKHHKKINEIYKQLGLLIRFSSLGKPYYLIPAHLVSITRTHIKTKVEEISKIIDFHRRKFLKEQHDVGILTQQDDLITHELSSRFKEHRFVIIDSLETLKDLRETLDLVIMTRDFDEIILTEAFSRLPPEILSRKRLDQYAVYILWKIYNLLKENGEIFLIANHAPPRTTKTIKVRFRTVQEEKSFILFTHIFKTKKKYRIKDHSLEVNVFDFQQYLSGLYVELEILDQLLGGRDLNHLSVEEVDTLAYLNFPLSDHPLAKNQQVTWSGNLSFFFDEIFLKPLVPQSVRQEWERRFSCPDYEPDYMLIYLGEKKPLKTSLAELRSDVLESGIPGCPPKLLADYRNSFDYVIRTLRVLERFKKGNHKGLPQIFVDRLRQPLENRQRRFHALNEVVRLISKINRLEKIRAYVNPDNIEGSKTKILENIEALPFFGLSYNELKEIFYIVLGHTSMGRIISGKMNEKTLKPVSDLARTYDPREALNLLRYCRLMTMAEIEASRGSQLTQEALAELFALYESTVRVVFTRDLDWERLLDEKISSMGGIHNKIIRKLLKMIGQFEFLDNWSELREKGQMEKESLADYDEQRLFRIENVINLVDTLEHFEARFLKTDPLRLPVFYRKLLGVEFHGTGHLFERMNSQTVFLLLWITVNVTRNEIINFNPILADLESGGTEERVKKVEQEAKSINIDYLELDILNQFSRQLYQNTSSFVVGTGFQLKVHAETQSLTIAHMDMDKDIKRLEALTKKLEGLPISEISVDELKTLEVLFSNLESFYQSHVRLLNQKDYELRLPARQKRWFQRAQNLRDHLRENFVEVIFRPEEIYTDLQSLNQNAPSLLNFILPEFSALRHLDVAGDDHTSSLGTGHIIATAKKIQALVRHDRESFQNIHFLHHLAQREFGPMATGIVGVSEPQIDALEKIVGRLSRNPALFEAFIMSFLFQDLGRIPGLRDKYRAEIHPADYAEAGALFLETERISEKYHLREGVKPYLIILVRLHSLLYHIIGGDFSYSALREILFSKKGGKDLFDALFVLSFIMVSAIREDLILEDLATQFFEIRAVCHRIIDGETSLHEHMDDIYYDRGALFYALEDHRQKGLPQDVKSAYYLEKGKWSLPERSECIEAGKMIVSLERLFRLRGIRYVGFQDLANLILKVPLKFIYRKHKFSNIGYATFEKEVYEAFRIYNTLQNLAEPVRHFVMDRLAEDKVRIYGYEKVSGYLSYENQIKLLLIGLLGTGKGRPEDEPVSLNFLRMSEGIDKRYEAVNDYFNALPMERIWDNRQQLSLFTNAVTGLTLKREAYPKVISAEFHDRINIDQKISYMQTISNVEQLKTYFHYSLQSLRKYPFYTEDYEIQLEEAFEKRLREITDMLLDQTKKQMDLINDFEGLHNLVGDLLERSLNIGFSEEQKHRLNDLYELRKDSLRREKLAEIENILATIGDAHELKDYWQSIKWYLQGNRSFFGKEFETLIAKRFDETLHRLSADR
jgi:hypothetical protein